jgi:hypothetical protein
MEIKKIMERAGISKPGIAFAYIHDGLDELAHIAEALIHEQDIDIEEGVRYYDIPRYVRKLTDIRIKGHDNEDNEYQSIPRAMHPPGKEDSDGV